MMWLRFLFFFSKQKTADEMRISDWSSDVCSSDLGVGHQRSRRVETGGRVLLDVIDKAQHALPGRFGLAGAQVGQAAVDAVAQGGPAVLLDAPGQIGRASGRERVCQDGWNSVVAGTIKKKKQSHQTIE